jgi:exoribonuclease R
MNEAGDLLDYEPRIHRSVIKSCAKWSYELVQAILDKEIKSLEDMDEVHRPIGGFTFEEMAHDCFKFNEIAQARR